jgi:outer membrane protein assembly factor BamA
MKQSGSVFFGEFMRNFGKQIFVGPRFQYRRLTASLGSTPPPGGFQIPQIDITSRTSALGVHIQRDLRDHVFYPRTGSLFDIKADFFGKWIGSNRTYQSYVVSYNGYHSLSKKRVLAYRAMACGVTDAAPFYDLCFYGRNDLRGYTAGEFQDRRQFATQVELRQELPYRLGLVGFAGVGGIARRWDEIEWNKLLPAGGVGLRFKLDKTNHINYRIDLGYGRNGPTVTFSVTEAF